MINNLLFDFTVDKTTNTVFITREFAAEISWFGMPLRNRKFLTNGVHLTPGQLKQYLWTLKLEDGDFIK